MMPRVASLIASLAVVVAVFAPPAPAALGEELRALLRELLIQVPSREVSAPAFTLPDVGGRRVRLADFQGQTLMIYFWTTY